MRVLITGATGYLGRAVTHHLAEAGHDVVATDQRPARDLPVPVHLADLLDPLATYRLAQGCEAVVHLANWPDLIRGFPPQRVYRDNVTMNCHIFEAAHVQGVTRLIFASSIQAASGTRTHLHADPTTADYRPSPLDYLPLDGDLPQRPSGLYGLSKCAGEDHLRHLAHIDPTLATLAIRFPHVVDAERLAWYRERRGRAGRRGGRETRLRGDTRIDEGFAFVLVEDAAGFIHAALQRAAPGYRCVLPAAPGNSLGRPARELIETYYADVPLRQPLDRLAASDSLVDLEGLERDWGWRGRGIDDA